MSYFQQGCGFKNSLSLGVLQKIIKLSAAYFENVLGELIEI